MTDVQLLMGKKEFYIYLPATINADTSISCPGWLIILLCRSCASRLSISPTAKL